MAFRERGCVRRLLRSHVDRPRTTRDMGNKAGSRLHHARSSYGYEHCAGVQCLIDSFQFERHLTKPADVRANPSAAFAPGDFSGWIVEICVVKRTAAARVAAAFEEFSVHVDNISRSSQFVEVVHVLGTNEKPILQQASKLGEGSEPDSVWLPKPHADAWSRTPTPAVDRGAKPQAKRPPRSDSYARARPRHGKWGCRFPRSLLPLSERRCGQ
jgi:hypothetical protein